ncbi:hypothetical protein [Acetatifactor aquisgranensis]|nr:hypothetical protein [Acetatifactor aquisgranensis]
MRLLVIEDDKQLAAEMKTGLERQGFRLILPIQGLPEKKRRM